MQQQLRTDAAGKRYEVTHAGRVLAEPGQQPSAKPPFS